MQESTEWYVLSNMLRELILTIVEFTGIREQQRRSSALVSHWTHVHYI